MSPEDRAKAEQKAARKRKNDGAGDASKAKSGRVSSPAAPVRPITHPRFQGRAPAHQVKILTQPSAPYHLDLVKSQIDRSESAIGSSIPKESSGSSTPSAGGASGGGGAGKFTCHICGFAANRLNVIVLHNKSHSEPAKGAASSPRGTPAKKTPAKSSPAASGRGRATVKPSPVSRRSAKADADEPKPSPPKRGRGRQSGTPAKAPPAVKPAAKETPKRGRGRPAKASPSPAPTPPPSGRPTRGRAAKAAAAAASPTPPPPSAPSPSPASSSPAPTNKRAPRMTKKRKEMLAKEEARKKEERSKIMSWLHEVEKPKRRGKPS